MWSAECQATAFLGPEQAVRTEMYNCPSSRLPSAKKWGWFPTGPISVPEEFHSTRFWFRLFRDQNASARHVILRTVRFLRDFGQRRRRDFWTETVESTETHDERSPFIGIDMIRPALDKYRVVCVSTHNTHFECVSFRGCARPSSKQAGRLQHSFQLDGALVDSRRANRNRWAYAESGRSQLVFFVSVADGFLPLGE